MQIFREVFGVFQQNFNNSKIVLSSAEDRAIFEDLKLRGQNQGLDLRGQGCPRGLQNVSSKPRTSLRTPPLVVILPLIPVELSEMTFTFGLTKIKSESEALFHQLFLFLFDFANKNFAQLWQCQ